jgi:AcrR family transcriptional regulator
VAQTKKKEVRRAILDAAQQVFSRNGYSNASISQIAKLANVSPANVYVYFPSKLDILFAIYDPWLTRKFDELERALVRIEDPSKRLKKILSTLWRDIPSANNGFANNMMQALSTTTAREGYKPTLRFHAETRLSRMLEECLPNLGRNRVSDLASILFMAFDGYIVNFHLIECATCPTRRLTLLADILLAYESHLPSPATGRRSVRQTPRRAARAAADTRAAAPDT